MESCRFEVGELLNKTNDGGIYRLLNQRKGYPISDIAVKLIDPTQNDNWKSEIEITDLAAEINIAPRVFDSCVMNFENKDYYGLVFEYIDNAKSINKIFQSEKINLNTVRQVKQLLDVMYNNGIVHNDLHGENVIFNFRDEPYIIDFGMSELFNDVIPFDKREYKIELSGPKNELIILDLENKTLTEIKYDFKTYKTTKTVYDI